jgi:hypothetical protein
MREVLDSLARPVANRVPRNRIDAAGSREKRRWMCCGRAHREGIRKCDPARVRGERSIIRMRWLALKIATKKGVSDEILSRGFASGQAR